MGVMGLILLLAGCQNDPIEPSNNHKQTTMELLSYSSPFLEVAPWSGTRANNDTGFNFPEGYGNITNEHPNDDHLPNGYKSYETLHPHASVEDSKIGVFMTPVSANPSGDFIYQGLDEGVSVWKSSIVVEEDKHYWIYGFMPKSGAETAMIAPLTGADTSGDDEGFAQGAVITINNYDAITTADVSVIAGLRWASESEKINGIAADGDDVPLGHFHYVGEDTGNNRIFVLLEHIYAGLHFATKLDPIYHGLRTIRITKVELTANNIRDKVNLVITLTANNTGLNPLTNVEYQQLSSVGSNKTITLYEKTDDPTDFGEVVPHDGYKDFLGCLVPGSTNNFVLTTTYDVYDTDTSVKPEGNLIRKGCVAENLINPDKVTDFPTLKAGELFTVQLLIKPTFLYVLSEPDLDNPTITISTTP